MFRTFTFRIISSNFRKQNIFFSQTVRTILETKYYSLSLSKNKIVSGRKRKNGSRKISRPPRINQILAFHFHPIRCRKWFILTPCMLDTIQDFLCMKPHVHLVNIIIFSLYHVIRPTKIIKDLPKDGQILISKSFFSVKNPWNISDVFLKNIRQ